MSKGRVWFVLMLLLALALSALMQVIFMKLGWIYDPMKG